MANESLFTNNGEDLLDDPYSHFLTWGLNSDGSKNKLNVRRSVVKDGH